MSQLWGRDENVVFVEDAEPVRRILAFVSEPVVHRESIPPDWPEFDQTNKSLPPNSIRGYR